MRLGTGEVPPVVAFLDGQEEKHKQLVTILSDGKNLVCYEEKLANVPNPYFECFGEHFLAQASTVFAHHDRRPKPHQTLATLTKKKHSDPPAERLNRINETFACCDMKRRTRMCLIHTLSVFGAIFLAQASTVFTHHGRRPKPHQTFAALTKTNHSDSQRKDRTG